jgi:predicted aspartyl protease
MTPLGKAGFAPVLLLSAIVPQLIAQVATKPSAESVAIAAPIELIHDKPYVSVMVDGHGPYRFLIDTGTGTQALVSPELVQDLSLPVVGHARLTDPSGQGNQRSEIVWIESLKIAGMEFKDIQAVGHRLFREEQNCQGVLGFTLFKDYLLTLDYPGRQMLLTSGALAQDSGGSLMPFRLVAGLPIATLRIEGLNLDAQIDTGGSGLSLPEQVAEQVKFLSTPIEFGTVESLATRFQIKAARLRPEVRIGKYAFRDAFVEINSAFPVVNVGSTPLSNFMITFDQRRLLMRVYAKQKVMRLNAPPLPLQMGNEPRRQISDAKLVPVG